MAAYAPEIPTTATLNESYPLTTEAEIELSLGRKRVSEILTGAGGLVAIIGPCAMNDQIDIIEAEGHMLRELTTEHNGLYTTHRLPIWKPRTNPEDWHGLETTDPEAAYATLVQQANAGGGTSIEIANIRQAERYGDKTVLSWIGSRNVGQVAMMEQIALHDRTLPLGVKNGLDGDIATALVHIERLSRLRTTTSNDPAPVVLLYRGGENAKSPQAWERAYRDALARTNGHMIVDIAHGSEMAHDLDGGFRKSSTGQIATLNHVIRIAEETGEMPVGIMAEASAADSPTDPHMPFQVAVEGILRLYGIVAGAHGAQPQPAAWSIA